MDEIVSPDEELGEAIIEVLSCVPVQHKSRQGEKDRPHTYVVQAKSLSTA